MTRQMSKARKRTMEREKSGMEMGKHVIGFMYILMGALFLPVLFCVVFIGNHMDYSEIYKVNALLPNYIFAMIALADFVFIFLVAWACRKIRLTHKAHLGLDGLLAILFLLLFLVNVRIAREIAFYFHWDVMVVTSHAVEVAEGNPLGYSVYFSMYTNNIPILYILKEIYSKAVANANYPYPSSFLWIEVNCALISLGGFFSCLTVKKLTNGLIPTLTAFLLYLALGGITPWKIAPYTDVFGIVFPIACIYFYLCYRETEKSVRKYLSVTAALMAGMLGGLVKPSGYIVVIAILMAELVSWLAGDRKRWHYILAEAGLVAALFLAKGACMDYMMKDMGLDFNPELEASWQHYFHMGQNGETTGTYSSDDESIFGEFQNSREDRDKAAFERAVGRVKDRGFLGNIYFWLKKMVMVFNDGTFGWQCNWIHEHYPPDLASNDGCMELLRNIFWPQSLYSGKFNAFCQFAWIFCMLGIAGICFSPKEQREKYVILVLAFLGIFCYQLLFEAKPRYLLMFLPLLCAVSACGMWQGGCRIHGLVCKWSFRQHTRRSLGERNPFRSLGIGQRDKAGRGFLERGTRQ